MSRRSSARVVGLLATAALLAGACSNGSGDSADTTAAPESSASSPETTAPDTTPETTPETTPDTTPETTPAPEDWAVSTDDCVDPDAANAPIEGTLKIGSVMPLTNSPAAGAFAPVKDGFEAYIKYANDNQLLGDLTLEFSVEDDEYNKDLTPGAATKLIDAGVHIFSGVIGSPNNGAIRDTLNAECIPQLLALTGSTAWGEVADYPWTTGALVPYSVESRVYARQIGEQFPDGARVAVFHVNNEFGQIYADAFAEIAEEYGIEIVDVQTVEADDTNPPISQITSIAGNTPDAIMAVPLGIGCIGFLKELETSRAANPGWSPTLFLTNTCASNLILGAAGTAADGLTTSNHLIDVNDPANGTNPDVVEYLAVLDSIGKLDVAPTATAGWNVAEITVAILKQALDSPEGLTRASIINAARNFEYVPTLVREGVVGNSHGEEDVFLFESLQVITYDADTATFTNISDLITDFET